MELGVFETWARDGVPANTRAWLVSTGRFKAIDAIRRHSKSSGMLPDLVRRNDEVAEANALRSDELEDCQKILKPMSIRGFPVRLIHEDAEMAAKKHPQSIT